MLRMTKAKEDGFFALLRMTGVKGYGFFTAFRMTEKTGVINVILREQGDRMNP